MLTATTHPSRQDVARTPDDPRDLGRWQRGDGRVEAGDEAVRAALRTLGRPVCLVRDGASLAAAVGGSVCLGGDGTGDRDVPVCGWLPPLALRDLGDPAFCAAHGTRFPYMAGSMANGIASTRLVEAMSRAGFLASFGAAGLTPAEVGEAVGDLRARLGDGPMCFNLIHSPSEPAVEAALVDLYIERRVRLVEASAYLDLTPAVVRYRVHGLRAGPDGRVLVLNRVIAKASRVEVARKWLSPPPDRLLAALREAGGISEAEAALARRVPMCDDLTAEADSGGHTDNRPAVTLLPTFIALRDEVQAEHGFEAPARIGAAGGIATPSATAAAFAMGAAYVVTGTVNQACVESGSSDRVRAMLAQTGQADVAMAPAADMFEMGVRLQVMKRGTMFPMRATRLYELYVRHDSIEALPAAEREQLERTVFKRSLDDVWRETHAFFSERDPAQVARAEHDPKHRMALVFRWYLGLSSRWANRGDADRQVDYQVWCGPAMGAFNEWTRGSFLEEPGERRVTAVGLNLMYGAGVLSRVVQLKAQGLRLAPHLGRVEPERPERIEEYLA